MTPWEVEWTDPAIASLRAIPYDHASSIVRVVDRFALTGQGRTYRLDEDDAATMRLRVGSYRVKFTKDYAGRLVVVWVVYRA